MNKTASITVSPPYIFQNGAVYITSKYVEGKIDGWGSYKGNIFYGIIKPGEELRGNKKTWLLAVPTGMFFDTLAEGDL